MDRCLRNKVRGYARTFAGWSETEWETIPLKGAENRLALLRLALAAGLVAGLLLSPNLWVSARTVLPLPYLADYALFGLFVALVAGMGVTRGRMAG